ncbi:hypothetical protein VNO77_15698 [Canavalia gladiata]|uniref:Activator of Hsp90 ATPase AHSA1-like N-terminal domain-containing protein n=1 Tax=Canavalia gladiata TaxID=3824 RepID=A0AAN9QVZ0_CANGL
MAKFGEGDKRWIVAERPDGTNVHNWHWAETNCLEWSRTFFKNRLNNLTVIDGDGDISVSIKRVERLDGEAYVNIRKGKVIPGYEINVTLAWEGEARDASGKVLNRVDGTVVMPYISDENAGEDPEVRVTVKDNGPIGSRLKEAMVQKGKPLILERVRVWEQSMAKGGPVKDELEAKKVLMQKSGLVSKKEESVIAENKKKEKSEGNKTISLTERFNCRARDLFEILMDENRWKGFTQSNARISKEIGGEFSIFDGSVTGTNLELQEGKLIVQRWRFGSWPDGMQSMVRIVFEEPEDGVTTVKLVHSDVPEEDRYGNATVVENTERGWRDLIFQRIRAVFVRKDYWISNGLIYCERRSVFCNDYASLLLNCMVLLADLIPLNLVIQKVSLESTCNEPSGLQAFIFTLEFDGATGGIFFYILTLPSDGFVDEFPSQSSEYGYFLYQRAFAIAIGVMHTYFLGGCGTWAIIFTASLAKKQYQGKALFNAWAPLFLQYEFGEWLQCVENLNNACPSKFKAMSADRKGGLLVWCARP